MTGLLPSAILDAYDFWQNEDDSLIGYAKKADGVTREQSQTIIKVSKKS
jgi:hypothetical protein